MPLPDEPYTITGGCNCHALRYRIAIPASTHRPYYPAGGESTDTRMPIVCTDHCNDCRSATGSVLPAWILTPIDMVSICTVSAASLPKDGKLTPESGEEEWCPALEVFLADRADDITTMSFFASSPNRRRSFCNRCGTMLSFQILPAPANWPKEWPVMLDIVLGTVDRECLDDGDKLKPERQLWWDCGVPWVQELSRQGCGDVPVHPKFKVDECVEL